MQRACGGLIYFSLNLGVFLHSWESLLSARCSLGPVTPAPVIPMSFLSLCCFQGNRAQSLGNLGLIQLLGKDV